MPRTTRSLADRFWPRVTIGTPDECWLWTGPLDANQRGRIGKGGRHGGVYRNAQAAWVLTYGTVPPGKEVCHYCDNPPCCNPLHLFIGTHAENMHDMWDKGRGGRHSSVAGERNPNAKLSDADVLTIRRRVAEGEMQKDLALEFKVTRTYLWGLVHHRHRKDVS